MAWFLLLGPSLTETTRPRQSVANGLIKRITPLLPLVPVRQEFDGGPRISADTPTKSSSLVAWFVPLV
jgi:hypothetical protein